MSKDNDKPKKKRKNEEQLKRQDSRIIQLARQVKAEFPDLSWRQCVSEGAKRMKAENESKKNK